MCRMNGVASHSLRPAEEVCRTRRITGRTTVRAAPRRVGAGSGPAATPGCHQWSGRDPHPHTRPPPCGLPIWIRPNPKQPARHSAWRDPENPPGVPEKLIVAGRCRDEPARRCAGLASCSDALDSGSIRRSRHHVVAWAATVARTNSTSTRHHACNSVPGPRRAGRQRHGGVFVAVPEPSPPGPRAHHDELTEQHFTTNRCR